MTSTNLDELLEEHKKIIHPYKRYEFEVMGNVFDEEVK